MNERRISCCKSSRIRLKDFEVTVMKVTKVVCQVDGIVIHRTLTQLQECRMLTGIVMTMIPTLPHRTLLPLLI